MRIGFIVVKNLLRGGGIETYTYEVGKRLVRLGHEVVVFSMGHYGDVPPYVEGMRVIRVPCLPGTATERLTASMSAISLALFYRPHIDILHFHTPMSGIFGLVPSLTGFATVVQMHGIDWQRKRWGTTARVVIRSMERAVMRMMPTCTAVSQTQVDFYKSTYGRRIMMIPTGTRLPHVSSADSEIANLGLSSGKFILFMSRLVPEKGAHLLLSAYRNLKTEYKLVIAGGVVPSDAYTESLLKLANGDPRIVFPGFVGGELKNQLLSHAALYVQPSEIEGLSIALLEAMSYSLPCLASDIPENIEAIGDYEFTFQSRNTGDLERQLRKILDHSEEYKAQSVMARDRVLREFSWDSVTDKLLTLYAVCLRENSAHSGKLAFIGRAGGMILGQPRS